MNEQPAHRQALPEGTRLQEFELRRFLGAGGFGIAYLGWNTELDIPVAIKEYLPSDCAVRERGLSVVPKSADDEAMYKWGLARFLEEAQVLARFNHRSIVQIYRFFRAHGTGYIAMEYVEGWTFSDWLASRDPLTERELRAILLPLLDGLEEVHRSGVVHRDIKPGNLIMRAQDDSPVLLDFGAARQTVMAKSRSVTAVLTPGYAPVEQYSEKGEQGPWTDIYALGALCYRALTGKVPEESLNRILEDTLEPLAKICRERGSPEFLRAVDWALQVRREDRPQNLREWRTVLEGGQMPKKSGGQKGQKTVPNAAIKLKSRWAGMLVLVLVLIVSGGGYFGWAELEERRTAKRVLLHLASYYVIRRPGVAQALRDAGTDVHANIVMGWTPLHLAVGLKDPALVQALLDAGSRVNAKTRDGRTPLDIANAFASTWDEELIRDIRDILIQAGGRCNKNC